MKNPRKPCYFYLSVHVRLIACQFSRSPGKCRTWCSGCISVLSCPAFNHNQHHNSDINNIFQLPHLGASHVCWLDWRALGPALDSVLRVRQQLLHNPHLSSLLSLERHSSSQQPFCFCSFFRPAWLRRLKRCTFLRSHYSTYVSFASSDRHVPKRSIIHTSIHPK